MALDEGLPTTPNRLGLVAVKTCRMDEPLELGQLGSRQRRRIGEASKQFGRHAIDPLISALRREDRGNQQLQRRLKVQLAVGIGIASSKLRKDSLGFDFVGAHQATIAADWPRVYAETVKRIFLASCGLLSLAQLSCREASREQAAPKRLAPKVSGLRAVGRPRFPSVGPRDAPIVLALFGEPRQTIRLEYADTARRWYPDDVRVIWIYNVWPDQTPLAALGLAAHRLDRFWEAHRLTARAVPKARPRCDDREFFLPTPIEATYQALGKAGFDLSRLTGIALRPELRAEVAAHWRIAHQLGLVRPARWQGGDFILINGQRLLTRRGFISRTQALATLRKRLQAELLRAHQLAAQGVPRDRLARKLALEHNPAFVKLIFDGQAPAKSLAIVVDRRLPVKQQRALLALTQRAIAVAHQPLAVTWVTQQKTQTLGAPNALPAYRGVVTPPPQGVERTGLAELITVASSGRPAIGFSRQRRVLWIGALPAELDSRLVQWLAKRRIELRLLLLQPLNEQQQAQLRGYQLAWAIADQATVGDLLLGQLNRSSAPSAAR